MGIDAGSPETRSYAEPAAITPDHRLDAFDCGKPALDRWLREHALDNEGRASRTYVVVARGGPMAGDVVAYYALATGALALGEIPRKYRHAMPNPVPALVLGRLAVDRRHARAGLGKAMLRQAIQRTLDVSRTAGVRMLVVHAIDDEAAAFYARHGFRPFPHGGLTMLLPVETLAAAL